MSEPVVTPQDPTPQELFDGGQINESERQFMELFERRSPTSEDDGGLTSAETEPEAQGTPDSTSDSAAPGAPATPVEGPEGAPAIEDGEVQPPQTPAGTSEQPAEVEPTGDEHAQSSPAFHFAGVDYTPDQLTNAVRVADWFSKLDNNQVQAIDALLSGQYRLAPLHEAAPTPPTAPGTSVPASDVSPAPGTTPPVSTGPAPDEAGEYLDPRAQAEINALKQALSQQSQQLAQFQETFKQSLTPVIQTQQQSHQQQQVAQLDAGIREFNEVYKLTDEQSAQIQAAVAEAGVFPSMVTRHGGNVQSAVKAAMDMMFWTTPQFRDPYLEAKSAATAADQTQQDQSTKRKQTLTALSASGGSVPRRDPVPSDRESRHSAMVDEIAAAQNGQ